MKSSCKPSKEKLEELYWSKKLSTVEIGKIFSVDHKTIWRWMVKYGIPRRTKSEAKLVKPTRYWLGKHRSKETIEKMKKSLSKIFKGRKVTWGDKISKAKKGEKHWNWKGGISKLRNRIFQSREYKKWRKAVFERDNYTCQSCGKRGCYLEAHHIKPFVSNPELVFELSNGITLCKECHKKVHREEKKFEKFV